MKQALLLTTFFCFCSLHAQLTSEEEKEATYLVYNVILNDRVENWFEHHFDKVLVVESFENKFDLDLELIDKVTNDSLRINYVRTLRAYTKPSTFASRFFDSKELRQLARNLQQDFKDHPSIKKKWLDVDAAKIEMISAERYYGYFGEELEELGDVWDKIWRKHGTKMVIELSKVVFKNEFAAVYYAHRCGGLCGAATLVMLENRGKKWEIIGEFNLWNSLND